MGLAKQGTNETGSERGIASTIRGAGPTGRAKARQQQAAFRERFQQRLVK